MSGVSLAPLLPHRRAPIKGVRRFCIPLCTEKIETRGGTAGMTPDSQILDWPAGAGSTRLGARIRQGNGMGRTGAIRGWLAAAMLGVGLAGGAAAGDGPVVVELYTSQGCSSCPPADALVAELARRDDVLPLALHVDYWDYIGWADSFADPAFTRRQKAYALVAGARTIYTPQMVVGGLDHLIGTRAMELGDLIEAHRARPEPVALEVARLPAGLSIRAEARGALPGAVEVQLVRFKPEQTVSIGRGENAGRTITYANIVTDWRMIGRWSGAAPLALTTELSGGDRAAVILQLEGPGAILAAAVVP